MSRMDDLDKIKSRSEYETDNKGIWSGSMS